MSLADDLRAAADTIEKRNGSRDLLINCSWAPSELRVEAAAVEAEEREADERTALAKELAQILREASIRGDYELYAGYLIESGWTKAESQ